MEAWGINYNICRQRKRTPKNIIRLQKLFPPNKILELYSDTESLSSDTIPEEEDGFKKDKVAGAAIQELNTGTKERRNALTVKSFPLQQVLGYDYFGFQRYLQLQSEFRRRLRLQHLVCGIPEPPMEYYTDGVLTKEFFDIYGRIDVSLEEGKQILATFKEGRLAEIKSWLEMEEQLKQDRCELKAYIKSHLIFEIMPMLTKKSYSERQLLYNQNPYKNSHNFERFILPRRLPREVRKVLGENISSNDETEEASKENSQILSEIDLRIFDPKFTFPNIVVQKQQYALHHPSTQKMLKLIEDYKLGKALVQFDNGWVEKFGENLNTSNYSPGTFAESISMFTDIFCVRSVGVSVNLLFPAYLNEFMVSTDELYKRLWRRLIFLLHYHSGKLPADENLVLLMHQFFRVDFKVCVDNIDFFVNDFLPKHFPQEDMIRLNKKVTMEPYLQFKILRGNVKKQPELSNEIFQKFQAKEETKIDAEKRRPNIPKKFTGFNDHVEWLSQYVRPGSNTICMGGELASLDCFYVNCLEFDTPLDRFMTKLQEEYKEIDQLRKATPHPESLIPGLIVAVAYKGVNNLKSEPEFNRAKIMEVRKDEKEKKYLVLFIDYGELLEVDFDDIKYLPKHFLTDFPAQAIECEANVNCLYKSCKVKEWQIEVMKLFLRKIQYKKMNIRFCHPSTQQPRVGSGVKWVVSIDLVSAANYKIIMESQLERKMLMELEGEYHESIPTQIDCHYSDDSIEYVN